jgi:hypothetical protein
MAFPVHSANNRHTDNWWLEDIAASLAAGSGGGGGAATIADGADVAEGATTDAAVAAGAAGTISAKLRRLTTDTAPATAIANGRKTVTAAGTAEALGSTTAMRSVIVQALRNNTGVIVVGGSGVIAAVGTRTGVSLQAGETTTVRINDLAKVFIDATVSGEGVSYAYVS